MTDFFNVKKYLSSLHWICDYLISVSIKRPSPRADFLTRHEAHEKVSMSFETRGNEWPFRLKNMFYYLMLMYLFLYQCSHQIKLILWKKGRVKVCIALAWVCVCSVMSDSATPWTVACWDPVSTKTSGQQYWSVQCPLRPPGSSTEAGRRLLLQGLFPAAVGLVSLASPASASLPRWTLHHCTATGQEERNWHLQQPGWASWISY